MGVMSILEGVRTIHKRRWSANISRMRGVDMRSASKIILLQDFQMDHTKARMAVLHAFRCMGGKSSERASMRPSMSSSVRGRPERETIFHKGRRRGAANKHV
jgi:hypothetical protein